MTQPRIRIETTVRFENIDGLAEHSPLCTNAYRDFDDPDKVLDVLGALFDGAREATLKSTAVRRGKS
ncbi:hypothetical protein SEA_PHRAPPUCCINO_166 [Mycobacterium phage Phrappuccino]|uniref:Uncharacterized protein n=1 Tax=Mycobacterium phage Phrappuccino TaxID=2591223 RepID=A0A514DE01_9CAUD|nr:hypothetical protein KHQ87_gp166 [Mycobacterium phage Phrappuccino]QDH91841.1 hypothetical protein SEA_PHRAPPUCCINO_166 [Mycobacterium phage Phrappuccino]QIQ63283.1 hypothetical protein SEA_SETTECANDELA_166 [Mycobacterium phage Settecandela]